MKDESNIFSLCNKSLSVTVLTEQLPFTLYFSLNSA